jgi:hypothetical protein
LRHESGKDILCRPLGTAQKEISYLSESDVSVSDWRELKPNSPFYLFVPRDEELLGEYECGWKMTKVLALPMRATHYQRITVALQETIRLMKEIDELIPGWPIE